jgi:hypothetical protein
MRRLWIPAVLGLGALGCPQRTAVWLVEPARADNLTFRIADKRGGHGRVFVDVFRVDRCDEPGDHRSAPMWGAGAGIGPGDTRLSEIHYGDMPLGYGPLMKQGDTALTLTPGCYTASTSGTGSIRFQVDSLGTVTELPGSKP